MSEETCDPEAEGIRMAIELYGAAESLLRERLRDEHPEETEEQIELRIREWLHRRPGAEAGDAKGRPGSWPRIPK